MADKEKDKKDNKEESKKKINFDLKKHLLIPFGGFLGMVIIVAIALSFLGKYWSLGPLAPELTLEEQIAEAEELENLDVEEESEESSDECEDLAKEKPEITPKDSKYYSERTKTIEDITVNIRDTNGRRFIVASFAIQAINKATIEELDEIDHWIHEKIISDLRTKTLDDVLDLDFQKNQSLFIQTIIEDFMEMTVTSTDDPCLGIIDSVIFTKLMIQ